MDLKDIDISQYDLIMPTSIEHIELDKPIKFIDIEVEDNHTFFFKTDDSNYVLTHNCDGTHIQSIYIGWFLKFGKELFSMKKVARLMTPLVILWADAKKTKIYKAFYSLGEYKDYETKHDISRYPKNYFKGLGSWSPEQFQHLFDSSPNGIEDYLQYFNIDENGETYVDDWLNSEKTDVRKQYLREYNLDIEKV